jgi:hypothetical protein
MWALGIWHYKVKLPWLLVGKVALISTLASLTGHYVAVRFSPLWAIVWGGSASLIVLFGLFYLMRVLEPEDRDRFNTLTGLLPKPIASPVNAVLLVLIRPEVAAVCSANV